MYNQYEDLTVGACLRILEAMGLEGWQEGDSIFALEPTPEGVQLVSFDADGRGLNALIKNPSEPGGA